MVHTTLLRNVTVIAALAKPYRVRCGSLIILLGISFNVFRHTVKHSMAC